MSVYQKSEIFTSCYLILKATLLSLIIYSLAVVL